MLDVYTDRGAKALSPEPKRKVEAKKQKRNQAELYCIEMSW